MDITDQPGGLVPAEEEGDYFENYWTRDKLMALSGEKELDKVRRIEIKMDSRKTGLGDLGRNLIGLQQLKLNNSYIPIIRDLGSGYNNLVYLWMARCHVKELDGIGSFSNLKELYLAYNDISDISDIGRLEFLEILDLDGNSIAEPDQIDYLTMCPNLTSLTVQGNPFLDTMQQQQGETTTRDAIISLLPSLSWLDDVPVKSGAETIPKRPATASSRNSTPNTTLETNQDASPKLKRPMSSRSSPRKSDMLQIEHHVSFVARPPDSTPLSSITSTRSGRRKKGAISEKIEKPRFLPPIQLKKNHSATSILPTPIEPIPPAAAPPATGRTAHTHRKLNPVPPSSVEGAGPIIILSARRRRIQVVSTDDGQLAESSSESGKIEV